MSIQNTNTDRTPAHAILIDDRESNVYHVLEVSIMKFMTIRELRSSTQKINESISGDGSLVITNNGKPAYIMLGVDEDNFEDTLLEIRRLKAKQATAQIQRAAADQGLDRLTMDDIDAEIKAARRARK